MKYVITLVHGTWPRGPIRAWLRLRSPAAWTNSASIMCSTLQQELLPASVIFERFIWSGLNNQSARRDATLRLRNRLRALLLEFSEAQHIIIAHSHGGNVAVQAISDDHDLRDRVGVVCLSTPFIHVIRNEVWLVRPFVFIVSSAVWALLISVYLWSLIKFRIGLEPPMSLRWTYGLSIVAAATLSCLLVKASSRMAERLQFEFLPLDMTSNNIVIIRSPGDEASGLLDAAHFFSWLTSQVLWLALNLWSLISSAMSRSGIQFAMSVFALIFFIDYFVPYLSVRLGIRGVLMMVSKFADYQYNVMMWSICVGVLAAAPLIGLTALFLSMYGLEFGLASLFAEVTAETTPVGIFTVHQLRSNNRVKGLRHSALYDDPGAIASIIVWIRERGAIHKQPVAGPTKAGSPAIQAPSESIDVSKVSSARPTAQRDSG